MTQSTELHREATKLTQVGVERLEETLRQKFPEQLAARLKWGEQLWRKEFEERVLPRKLKALEKDMRERFEVELQEILKGDCP